MNANKENVNYTASNEITEDTSVSDTSYTSSNSDENALIVLVWTCQKNTESQNKRDK